MVKEGCPLGGGSGVEASGSKKFLEEGGIAAAREDVSGFVFSVKDELKSLEETTNEFGVLALDKGADATAVEADGRADSLFDKEVRGGVINSRGNFDKLDGFRIELCAEVQGEFQQEIVCPVGTHVLKAVERYYPEVLTGWDMRLSMLSRVHDVLNSTETPL